MTEKQAWLTIAMDMALPRKRAKYGFDPRKLERCLCWAINNLRSQTSEDIREFMKNEIWEVKELLNEVLTLSEQSAYFCDPQDPANDLLRADFCYLQYYRLGGE